MMKAFSTLQESDQARAVETVVSSQMTPDILRLLEAWPAILFGGHQHVEDDMTREILRWFLFCTTSSDDAIRGQANEIARLFFDESQPRRHCPTQLKLHAQSLRVEFWQRRYYLFNRLHLAVIN